MPLRTYICRDKNIKIANIFLSISLTLIAFSARKKRLIEAVLLSTHNITFWLRIKELSIFFFLHTFI